MKNITIATFAAVLCFAIPQNAMAQDISRSLEQLSAVNEINPRQNPNLEGSERILDRNILDRKNKVVGEVQDITIKTNGTIDSIVTAFDRLRLNNTVYLNFRNMRIRPTEDGYALAMDSEEIEDFYPNLLADIATASGAEDETFSTKNMIGAKLKAEDGRNLGEIREVLFGLNGTRVTALLAEINIGTTRGDLVAIPFRTMELTQNYSKITATVSDEMADAIIEVADN